MNKKEQLIGGGFFRPVLFVYYFACLRYCQQQVKGNLRVAGACCWY